MKFSTRRTVLAAALALALPLTSVAADFPVKPVTLVVPQGTGSGSDVVARLLAVHMGAALGQSVVVENRAGGGGIIAHQSVARAPADGYTILLTSTAQLLVVPAMNASAKYSLDDFAPVAPVLRAPFAVLVANTPAAPKTLKELMDVLRTTPSAYASAGTGTMTHLGSEIFLRRAGLKATHIPYKGSGAALTDLIGGQMLFATDSLTAALTHVRSGKLRVLAVTGDRREASLPDVPTLAELGFRNFEAPAWWAVIAPSKMSPELIQRMNAELTKAMQLPDVAAKLAQQGISVSTGTPAQAQAFVDRQLDTWGKVVRDNGITPD